MALISLTRLAAVSDPFSSLKLSSRFTISALKWKTPLDLVLFFYFVFEGCLICAWLYGSMWIMPPSFGWNRFILEGFSTSCTFDYISRDPWDRAFILMLVTGGFLMPLSVILISYALILIRLSQRNRRFLLEMTTTHSTSHHGSTYFFNHSNLHEQRERSSTLATLDGPTEDHPIPENILRTEARATRTAFLICALFCLAWGPYAVMALISLFGFNHLVNAYTTAVLGMFTKVAACINPLIYALSLNGFQEQLCAYLKRLFGCEPEPSRRNTPLRSQFHQKKSSNTQSSH